MIRSLLPVGIRGLVMAGFLAALMSSLAAVFNSCSTLITWDVYRKIRPDASERQLVVVGKLATLLLVGFGLLWIPLMKHISGQLYVYLQSVQAYISPPIAAVFLLGVFWKRVNSAGAIASLATGFVLGAARLGPGARPRARRAERSTGTPTSTSCTSRCCCSRLYRGADRREPADAGAAGESSPA